MRLSRPFTFQAVAIALIAITNFLMAAFSWLLNPPELFQAACYGLYGGESLVVAIWIAWGAGTFPRRTGYALAFGGIWGVTSWLGVIAVKGMDAFDYRYEMLQLLYVPPISLVIIVSPLALFRVFGNWQLQLPATGPMVRSNQFTLKQFFIVMSVVSIPLAGIAALRYRMLLDNVMVAIAIGVVLGPVALASCPFIVAGILRSRLRLALVAPPVIIVLGIAWCIGSLIGLPGPGGGSGVSLVPIASAFGETAIAFVCVAAVHWRMAGYRLHSGRIRDAESQASPPQSATSGRKR